MNRKLEPFLKKDLDTKIVLLSGPRQVGKTTLSKILYRDFDYLNFDSEPHRKAIFAQEWDRKKDMIIFDEIHKMKEWKRWLKGIYDVEGNRPRLLVTGSAKLTTFKKMGDSLAGRYFHHRLYPLDFKELKDQFPTDIILERLMSRGGFPEPFLTEEPNFAARWRKTHLDIILRQDLLDLHTIRDLKSIETLIILLQDRVGSPISYQSLAEDLHCDATTIKRWLELLEDLYVIFKVTPYHKNIARSILKNPKYYFFDTGRLSNNPGARFENCVALCLLKECHFLEDTQGKTMNLGYIRNKEKEEIDFIITNNGTPTHLIEAKWADTTPAKAFRSFGKYLPPTVKMIQLVGTTTREFTTPDHIEIRKAETWLTTFNLD